jgi:integrase
MNLNQLNIYFYVRPSAVKGKRGTFYTRVVINNQQIVCSVKSLRIYKDQFDHKKGIPKSNCEMFHECNDFMLSIRKELYKIHHQYENDKMTFTKECLVKAVEDVYYRIKHGHQARSKTYLEFYDIWLEDQRKRVGSEISMGTFDVRSRYKKVIALALDQCELTKKPICNFCDKDVLAVQNLLRRKIAQGTAMRIFPVFSMVFNYALQLKEVADNPCKLLPKVRRQQMAKPVFLEPEEVQRISNLNLTGQAKRYRDAFLFCCFTGLSIGDYELLNPSRAGALIKKAESPRDIQPGRIVTAEYGAVIQGKRRKTGTEYRVPLLPQAEAIINEYGGLDKLPYVISKSGHFLQVICSMAGIDKKIKFHTARKTMANYCINVKMMNPYYVTAVLGWSDIKEADDYVTVTSATLNKQLKE